MAEPDNANGTILLWDGSIKLTHLNSLTFSLPVMSGECKCLGSSSWYATLTSKRTLWTQGGRMFLRRSIDDSEKYSVSNFVQFLQHVCDFHLTNASWFIESIGATSRQPDLSNA